MSIGDVARRTGLTVRALRHYENMGLLKPQRSETRQRVYAFRDVTRLQHIQTLKRTGLTLHQIRKLIDEDDTDARHVLTMQRDLALEARDEAEQRLRLIDEALACASMGEPADLSTLCHIIKMGENAVSEEKWQKVWDKFYSPEEQERWQAAKTKLQDHMSDPEIREYEQRWPALIARAEKLVGTDPTAPAAQAMAREWFDMTDAFMKIDPALGQNVAKLYDNLDHWPKDGPEPPFTKEVWEFVKAAGTELKRADRRLGRTA